MFFPVKNVLEKLLIVICISLFCYLTFWNRFTKNDTYSIIINTQLKPIQIIEEKFLSVGLDTIEIANGVDKLNFNKSKLIHMVSLLSPGYLRLGGTMSDRLIFSSFRQETNKTAHTCDGYACLEKYLPYFIMYGDDWLKINKFVKQSKLKLLFDFNVLLRNRDNWNPTNAIDLLKFSSLYRLDVDWQLGNEPNSFQHVFNISISAQQLGKDFSTLRQVLRKYYPNSLLVGPDTTRPQPNRPDCVKYMKEFLSGASDYIDAMAWHQYYLNGRTAALDDFWDPEVMNLLQSQIDTMVNETQQFQDKLKMWLTETSSAYGGGAPGLSNSFAGSPLWLDKLGTAALNGIQVVIRQSILGASYSLIDHKLTPLPDWWVSFLFKKLVGQKVASCRVNASKYQRFYCHCAQNSSNTIALYGMNLEATDVTLSLSGSALTHLEEVDEYLLTAPSDDRMSKDILLNGDLLSYVDEFPSIQPKKLGKVDSLTIKGYSLGFWIMHNVNIPFCKL